MPKTLSLPDYIQRTLLLAYIEETHRLPDGRIAPAWADIYRQLHALELARGAHTAPAAALEGGS